MKYLSKIPSDVLTANSLVYTGSVFYFGFTWTLCASDVEIVVYDSTSATGKVADNEVASSLGSTVTKEHTTPVFCRLGLYVVVPAGSVIVYYQPIGSA